MNWWLLVVSAMTSFVASMTYGYLKAKRYDRTKESAAPMNNTCSLCGESYVEVTALGDSHRRWIKGCGCIPGEPIQVAPSASSKEMKKMSKDLLKLAKDLSG